MYEDYLTRLRLVEYFEIIARTAVRNPVMEANGRDRLANRVSSSKARTRFS